MLYLCTFARDERKDKCIDVLRFWFYADIIKQKKWLYSKMLGCVQNDNTFEYALDNDCRFPALVEIRPTSTTTWKIGGPNNH